MPAATAGAPLTMTGRPRRKSHEARGRRTARRGRRRASGRSALELEQQPRRGRVPLARALPSTVSSDAAPATRSGQLLAAAGSRSARSRATTAAVAGLGEDPATLRRSSITSFGHLIWTREVGQAASIASATATPATSESSGSAPVGRRLQQDRSRGSPFRAAPPPSGRGGRGRRSGGPRSAHRALRHDGLEQAPASTRRAP